MKKILSWLPTVAIVLFSVWAASIMFDAGFELKETGSMMSLFIFAGIGVMWFAAYALYLTVDGIADKAAEE